MRIVVDYTSRSYYGKGEGLSSASRYLLLPPKVVKRVLLLATSSRLLVRRSTPSSTILRSYTKRLYFYASSSLVSLSAGMSLVLRYLILMSPLYSR